MPHVAALAKQRRRVVVIGAGPAGLEAARVCGERGHEVTVVEALDRAGGQIVLAARLQRRRELLGIVEWRLAELARHGAQIRYNEYADDASVLQLEPDVVFVATGGVPQLPPLEQGQELVRSAWDVLAAPPTNPGRVLVFDDHGGYAAMQAAEQLAEAGAEVDLVSPERFFAPEMGGLNHAQFATAFADHEVTVRINARLAAVDRTGNGLEATFTSDYSKRRWSRTYQQVETLVVGGPQTIEANPAGLFRLYRIGDAVAGRNIHAAIYDALRIAKSV
jgi:pyruvate/2-oxoglutarate dehydrogenase complex dihydrolipoamide dehydrogenase (E3) component